MGISKLISTLSFLFFILFTVTILLGLNSVGMFIGTLIVMGIFLMLNLFLLKKEVESDSSIVKILVSILFAIQIVLISLEYFEGFHFYKALISIFDF